MGPRHQAWIYLLAILLGLGVGSLAGESAGRLELLVWPTLGLLLFATFTQVTVTGLPAVLRDRRFLAAVLVGNFVVLPLVVRLLLELVGPDRAVRLGVLLVLLVPCTDWFVTFTQLAGGDTRRAIAVTPLNLVVQLAVLPVYLWLFLAGDLGAVVAAPSALRAFATLILLPLAAAWGLQLAVQHRPRSRRLPERFALLPVPLLALVVFLIAASQVGTVLEATGLLPRLALAYVLFLVAAAAVGLAVSRLLRLPATSTRVVVFSLGTRNSFVVLPVALALPDAFSVAVVVVVFQSLVELVGMVAYLEIVPRLTGPVAEA